MGKTHGMTFSSSPPSSAPSSATSTAGRRAEDCLPSVAGAVPAAGTLPGTALSHRPLPSLSFNTPSTVSMLVALDGASVSTISASPEREKVWPAA